MTNSRHTSELNLFRKTVRDFAEKEMRPHIENWEKAGGPPKEFYKEMAEMSFFGIRYPEELGGLGQNFLYTEAFCEEIVKGSTALGVITNIQVHMDMATPIIGIIGNKEQQEEFLKPAISGDKWFALGISEPDTGSDVARIRTTAKRDGNEYVINGAKTFITNGSIADYITLAVRTGDEGHKGISLIVFPTNTKGFSVGRKLNKIGWHSSDTAELHFDNCRVPVKNLLGEENQGFYYIMKNFQGERLIIALDAVSISEVIFEDALNHMKERKTFGKSLLDHQALRHEMVDLKTEILAAKLLCHHATDIFVSGKNYTDEVSMAKIKATELATQVALKAGQMFGGYSYMEEYPIARYLRDVRVLNIVGGTTHIMKEIVGKNL